MDSYEGWVPDPFGAHEVRYFVDGKPTKLVRDGSVEGFDDLPPRSTWPAELQQPDRSTTPPAVVPIEPTTQPPPPPPPGISYWSPPPPPEGVGVSSPTAGPATSAGPDDTFVGAAEPAPVRRPRKRLAAGVAALVVAVAAGTVAAVVSGGTSAQAAVIDSVNSTMADGTAHVTMQMALDSRSSTITGTGTGDIDFSQNALQLQMELADSGQQIPVKALYIGGSIYESIPGLDQVVPGKSWISIDIGALTSGRDSGALGAGNNPTAMLRLLALQGNKVTSLGSSVVDGVTVEGYSVKFNPATLRAQLSHANLPSWMTSILGKVDLQSASNTVFVDGSGHLRRYSVKVAETVASAGKVSVDESLDFSDYGTPVSVSAPPSDQVVSFVQFVQDAEAAGAPSS